MFNYDAPNDLLVNKTIFISGANKGIGKTAALTYAKFGATVILSGRDIAGLEAVYDEIEQAGYTQAAICPLDLSSTSYQDYQNVADLVADEFGTIDGLLNNASILGSMTPIESFKVDEWMACMQVNVNGSFMLTKALLPLLRSASSASIIFTSSSVGRKGRAYWGAYSVSKFATEGFMQVLADELAATSKVRVNCINPGATNTAMRHSAYPMEDKSLLAGSEDIMPVYLYLMGDDSTDIHGQSLDAQA